MKRIRVRLEERSYDILIGRALLQKIGSILKRVSTGRKVCVISNERVAKKLGFLKKIEKSLRASGFSVVYHELPYGDERDKSFEVLAGIWKKMTAAGLDRNSIVIALGGGVVGDIAGFAASTFMRGIRLVQIPTTLLAQVDSAIGGKTGIDFQGIKNMVGTFYQPSLVLSDLELLSSLSVSDFENSFSEIVKYGVIRDPKLFKLLERDGDLFLSNVQKGKCMASDYAFLETVVYRSALIKAKVVERDEKETKGERIILNYGHTFAHVLESASHYRISHGEAVGLGMILAGSLALKLKLVSETFCKKQFHLISRICPANSLKAHEKHLRLSWEKFKHLFLRDKKSIAGKVRFILPASIGKVKVIYLENKHWELVRKSFAELGLSFN